MRRLVRWWRALLALGREDREVRVTMWSDPSHWTAAQRREFAKSIDEGLDELAANRKRRSA